MNTEPEEHEPDAWLDIAAEGLTAEHVGRRVTVLTIDGLAGLLTSWRPMNSRRRGGIAGIAHIFTAAGDRPVALRARTRIRIHLEAQP
jgi:hypothetical protein